MNIEDVREYCLSLAGVTEDMPYGPDCVVYRIGGKIFLHIALESGPGRIAIKLPPEAGADLRERFGEIRPAFHMNKTHWNDVYLTGTLAPSFIAGLIHESYMLVYSKLPRKVKDQLLVLGIEPQ